MIIDSITSKLDEVKTTITISMGTKNRLRKIKEDISYEDFINHLIKLRNEFVYSKSVSISSNANIIEYNKFDRIESVFSENNYKIIFMYNKFIPSDNFMFDIKIKNVVYDGKRINYNDFLRNESLKKSDKNEISYGEIKFAIYFKLLSFVIQKEVLSNFKHNGTFKDYFSWKKEFEMLRISNKSFEEDVMEKLENFQRGYQ